MIDVGGNPFINRFLEAHLVHRGILSAVTLINDPRHPDDTDSASGVVVAVVAD